VAAGFWLRFAASLVDGFIVTGGCVLAIGAFSLFAALLAGAGVVEPGAAAALGVIAFWLLLLVGQWAYFALMESSARQATLGKQALGLAVTDLEGERIALGRATGRFLGKILSGIPLNLGYVMAAFTARKQALHDMVAGTLVVRRGQTRTAAIVVAAVAGVFAVVAIMGILAAIAVPNFIRYQLRAKESEAPAMLRALHAAELSHQRAGGGYVELAGPAEAPGTAKLAWGPAELAAASELGWPVAGSSWFTYHVAVAMTPDGSTAFATCAESDLDGDGAVSAWVTWQPVTLADGERVAPEPPCAHEPSLERPLALQPDDPEGTPVKVSAASVF
jgi:uncharacterized RDD family membrane protein YckC/type II secretory pathway pseudopilin PulG